ncbi:hypothetical protein HOP50_07g48200 [Chloropicon primus]|uniref:Uncharacterized protein n=1 Tax=Chloropicon primus TaxID=1764295 RepID=A0A5B8MSG3_9CHLO|nr:hypothetical protein A3770_07p48000 [Chloropicon primus]UPR01498.1 hypothetical protein HOP50_07g48200 [Chloropicon primus]|eukprot:QDZ22282.1 hypothetical protein A3770_07p48000 [Chloropicon primus]
MATTTKMTTTFAAAVVPLLLLLLAAATPQVHSATTTRRGLLSSGSAGSGGAGGAGGTAVATNGFASARGGQGGKSAARIEEEERRDRFRRMSDDLLDDAEWQNAYNLDLQATVLQGFDAAIAQAILSGDGKGGAGGVAIALDPAALGLPGVEGASEAFANGACAHGSSDLNCGSGGIAVAEGANALAVAIGDGDASDGFALAVGENAMAIGSDAVVSVDDGLAFLGPSLGQEEDLVRREEGNLDVVQSDLIVDEDHKLAGGFSLSLGRARGGGSATGGADRGEEGDITLEGEAGSAGLAYGLSAGYGVYDGALDGGAAGAASFVGVVATGTASTGGGETFGISSDKGTFTYAQSAGEGVAFAEADGSADVDVVPVVTGYGASLDIGASTVAAIDVFAGGPVYSGFYEASNVHDVSYGLEGNSGELSASFYTGNSAYFDRGTTTAGDFYGGISSSSSDAYRSASG